MNYIEYVTKQLEIFRKGTKLIDDNLNEVTPYLLNSSLSVYTQVNITLNGEYQRKKLELSEIQTQFNVWWDEKFIEIKYKLNPKDIPTSKWSSKAEIESELRATYKDEYLVWKRKLNISEMGVAFIRRLLEQWKLHCQILITLSYNMRTEMKSLSVGEMSERPYVPLPEKPVRKKKE